MTPNIHSIERPIRIVVGLGLIVGGAFTLLSSWVGVALILVGFVPLITGAMGSCPAYTLLGISTAGEK